MNIIQWCVFSLRLALRLFALSSVSARIMMELLRLTEYCTTSDDLPRAAVSSTYQDSYDFLSLLMPEGHARFCGHSFVGRSIDLVRPVA